MKFLDINTFYCKTGGGIRTYHNAKLDYFRDHPQHSYTLVYPGPSRNSQELSPNVRLEEVWGPALTKNPSGYRLLLDFPAIHRTVRELKPDVLEVGDPWLNHIFCILNFALGARVKTMIYHSDPLETYINPWIKRYLSFLFPGFWLMPLLNALFYRSLHRYQGVVTTSETMASKLKNRGIARVFTVPFGIRDCFFNNHLREAPLKNNPVRLLYAGRLDADKGVLLLKNVLEKLLSDSELVLTVVGRGAHANFFRAFKHPRYRFLEFVESPEELSKIYVNHRVFLAPGQFETFGLAALEAMASGMIVVGPNGGGVGELLEKLKAPFIFKSGDSRDFFKTILMATRADFREASLSAINLAAEYGGWPKTFDGLVEKYAALANKREVEGQ